MLHVYDPVLAVFGNPSKPRTLVPATLRHRLAQNRMPGGSMLGEEDHATLKEPLGIGIFREQPLNLRNESLHTNQPSTNSIEDRLTLLKGF